MNGSVPVVDYPWMECVLQGHVVCIFGKQVTIDLSGKRCKTDSLGTQVTSENKTIVDYTSPALCTPVTPCRPQAMRPIVNMPEVCRATDIGNMHKKIWQRSRIWFRRYILVDRQTDTQTDILVTILPTAHAGEVVTNRTSGYAT